MAEPQEPKSGRFQRWRERRKASAERARGIKQRSKQIREGEFENYKRKSGTGVVGGPTGPMGI